MIGTCKYSSYAPNGKQKAVIDANGDRAELRYDGHDRLLRWVFLSKTTPGAINEADYEAYAYDLIANLPGSGSATAPISPMSMTI